MLGACAVAYHVKPLPVMQATPMGGSLCPSTSLLIHVTANMPGKVIEVGPEP